MIIWRPYEPPDNETLKARHEAACAAMGAEFEYPDLTDPRYLMAEVAVKDGRIVGAVIAHATIEVMFIGAEPSVAKAAVRDQRHLRQRLLSCGADEAHAFVPRRLVAKMEPILKRMGFRRSNEAYVAFYREI